MWSMDSFGNLHACGHTNCVTWSASTDFDERWARRSKSLQPRPKSSKHGRKPSRIRRHRPKQPDGSKFDRDAKGVVTSPGTQDWPLKLCLGELPRRRNANPAPRETALQPPQPNLGHLRQCRSSQNSSRGSVFRNKFSGPIAPCQKAPLLARIPTKIGATCIA